MPKEIGMKKLFVSVIFFAIGLICVQAQTQAVPRPPLPVFTFTQDTPQAVRQNVSEAQARQLIENRDQLKYAEYLKNSGYITQDEFDQRSQSLNNDYYAALGQIGKDISIYISVVGVVEKEIDKLWPTWSPGWPAKEIRKTAGFNLQQPEGTRSSFNFSLTMIRGGFTPYSEEAFNNIKEQLEANIGMAMEYNEEFNDYRYILPSNKSASGKYYQIGLRPFPSPSGNRIYLEIAELME